MLTVEVIKGYEEPLKLGGGREREKQTIKDIWSSRIDRIW